jgi:hypothetical protein
MRIQTIVCRSAAAAIAIALTACDTWGPDKTVTAPSDDPSLVATIRSPTPVVLDTRIVGDLIPFACSSDGQFTGPLDITMTAAHDVDLDEVTLRLVRLGEFASSSTNRFSREDLAKAHGSTEIRGGTVKTLRFRTRLACGQKVPDSVAADIRFVEFSGRRNSITATALFVSEIGGLNTRGE